MRHLHRLPLLAALLAVTLLAACGFHLRGQVTLPFDTLFVPPNTSLAVDLKRAIAAGTQTRLVATAAEAQARLVIESESREKIILSLDTSGRVAEYQLRSRVSFRVVDNRGLEYLPLNTITLTRDITFNDAEVLAKESEESLLYRDMQTDTVQQILRRLSAAAHAPEASAGPAVGSTPPASGGITPPPSGSSTAPLPPGAPGPTPGTSSPRGPLVPNGS